MSQMLVRMKKAGHHFEVLVNEGMVSKYREGTVKDFDEVCQMTAVFNDAGKALKASEEQLQEAFGTTDVEEAMKIIVRTGDAQESAHERKEKVDAKRQEIINSIQKNYSSPEGHHLPVTRIENALDKMKARIDVDVDADRQVASMFQKLTEVMPIKKNANGMEGVVVVPTKLAGVVSSTIRKHATVNRETYSDKAKYEIEINNYELLMKDLSRVTKGEFEFNLNNKPVGDAGPTTYSGGHGSMKGRQ